MAPPVNNQNPQNSIWSQKNYWGYNAEHPMNNAAIAHNALLQPPAAPTAPGMPGGNTLAARTQSPYQSAASMVSTTTPNQASSMASIMNGTYGDRIGEATAKGLEYANQKQLDWDNSLIGKASPYIGAASGIASTMGSLANIYLGFQQMGIMKEQLGMAREQWAEQKQELQHVRGVRKRLTSQYMS